MLAPLSALLVAAAAPVVPLAHDTGTVRADSLTSAALGVRKRVLVYLPPSYGHDARRRYPVVYLLHGLWGDETNWTQLGRANAAMDSLVAAGGREMIVVMPDGDDGWYTTWARPADRAACVADTARTEPAASYCVAAGRYDDYVAHDVVRHVDGRYRTIARRDGRAIAGLSMGGYGAVTLALRHPELFAAAASHSGILAPLTITPRGASTPGETASTDALRAFYGALYPTMVPAFGATVADWRARDPGRLLTRAATRVALFIDVGADDPWVAQSRAFRAAAERAGARVAYAEWPGGHTWAYWRAHVPASLAWLAARLAPSEPR